MHWLQPKYPLLTQSYDISFSSELWCSATHKFKVMCHKCHPFIPEFICVCQIFWHHQFFKSSIYKVQFGHGKHIIHWHFILPPLKSWMFQNTPYANWKKLKKQKKNIIWSYIFSCTHLTVQQLQGGKHVMQKLAWRWHWIPYPSHQFPFSGSPSLGWWWTDEVLFWKHTYDKK